jgi:hypothetical protein
MSRKVKKGNVVKKSVVAPRIEANSKALVSEEKKLTSAELIIKLKDFFKSEGAVGYICGVVGADSKILPYVGASSIGDLLTIKYVVDKEISRLIDGQPSKAEEAASSAQQ